MSKQTSYEELNIDQRAQVDAFMENTRDVLYNIDDTHMGYLREDVSNLAEPLAKLSAETVLTCVYIEQNKSPKPKRVGRGSHA